jgi:Flagellar protein FliT
MDNDYVALLVERAYHYLDDMDACLQAGKFNHLNHLEDEYASLIEEIQLVRPEHVQPFAMDFELIATRLTQLRDIMVQHRDQLRTQLSGIGQTSTAAKAYVKSSFVHDSNNNEE